MLTHSYLPFIQKGQHNNWVSLGSMMKAFKLDGSWITEFLISFDYSYGVLKMFFDINLVSSIFLPNFFYIIACTYLVQFQFQIIVFFLLRLWITLTEKARHHKLIFTHNIFILCDERIKENRWPTSSQREKTGQKREVGDEERERKEYRMGKRETHINHAACAFPRSINKAKRREAAFSWSTLRQLTLGWNVQQQAV